MKKYIFLLLILLIGCKNEHHGDRPTPPTEIDHTVIVYMVADNNLGSDAVNNINAMESAYSDASGARILVYYNMYGGESQLLEIKADDGRTIASKVLKDYGNALDPCLPETLSDVVADCRELSVTDKYSMVFWSHGTCWLPQGMHPAKAPTSPEYTFGATDTFDTQMEIYDLADALPSDLVFEYIYFDACHMGSLEVAYELRKNAKYLVGSAAEILAEGYPYAAGLEPLLKADAIGVAEAFFDCYNKQSGVMQSATISVTDLSKIEDVSAELRKLVPVDAAPTAVQQFGRNLGSRSNFKDLMWDAGDMAKRTYGEEVAKPFLEALDRAIIYKAATPYVFYGDYYGQIEINEFCGLSIYIPLLSEPQTLDIYTNNYDWAKDSEFYLTAH